MLITVRSRNDASQASQIRAGILALDPELTVTPVLPLGEYTAVAILPQKFSAGITAALSVLALILCAIGIYGLVAHLVARQTREIGIRMALGADQSRVLRQFLGHAFKLALPGLVFGTVAGLGVGYALRTFLIGLSPTDPAALIGGGVTLTLVVIVASLVPAHRASRTDPMAALRTE